MKRIFLLSLISLCFAAIFSVYAHSSDYIYMMTLNINTECISNNYVGSDWVFKCSVNDKSVSCDSSNTVYLNSNSIVTFQTVIMEQDDSINDVGSNTGIYIPSILELFKGFEFSHEITVIEKGGRNAGNKAVWKITYLFTEYKPDTSKKVEKDSSSQSNNKYFSSSNSDLTSTQKDYTSSNSIENSDDDFSPIKAILSALSVIMLSFLLCLLIAIITTSDHSSNHTTYTNKDISKKRKESDTSIPQTETPDPTAEAPPQPPPRPLKKNANKAFPLYAKDRKGCCYMLKFQYRENLCLYGSSIEKLEGKEGCIISFKQEPENTYDKWAVAVYLGDERVGYIYRGEVQRLTNSWINKGNKVVGFINSVGFPYGTVTYKIGFYSQTPYIPNDFID